MMKNQGHGGRRHRGWQRWVLALVLGGVVLPGCAELRIAVIGPFSGLAASEGNEMLLGARAAVARINRNGGVLEQPLALLAFDDQCRNRPAVEAASQAANSGVILVVGHLCSDQSIIASDLYDEEGILQISPSSTSVAFTERGLDNVFRVVPRDDAQARLAGRYIVERHPGARVGLIHNSTGYGRGLEAALNEALVDLGQPPIWRDALSQRSIDVSGLVDGIVQQQIELLYLGVSLEQGIAVVKALRARGLSLTIIGGDALVSDRFWRDVGEGAEGVMATFPPDPTELYPAAQALARELREAGQDPVGYTLYAYAVVEIFQRAVERLGYVDFEDFKTVLRREPFDTVIGPVAFDAKGDRVEAGYGGFVMYRMNRESGSMEIVYPAPDGQTHEPQG
ncbi:MAG: branched-chain amino acid ABC transporter substrate-binding protein [Candidatus Competibacterales bacterium]